jgi:hypothetical protein
MATGTVENKLSDEDVICSVRWRFRICGYLFKLAFAWLILGFVFGVFVGSNHLDSTADSIWIALELVGVGIFSAAFTITLAIYRCPVCNKYLSRFRPRKEYCPSCGSRIQEAKLGDES